jgi:hypothetical protein
VEEGDDDEKEDEVANDLCIEQSQNTPEIVVSSSFPFSLTKSSHFFPYISFFKR